MFVKQARKVGAMLTITAGVYTMMASTGVRADNNTIQVSGAAEDHSIDCKGQSSVTISGSANNVSIRNCRTAIISGASNNIAITSTPSIRISGASNDIIVTLEIEGAIKISGGSNNVTVIEKAGLKTLIRDTGLRNDIVRKTKN